jgi:pimeloyl-ACP methyl ester carboxylesterase
MTARRFVVSAVLLTVTCVAVRSSDAQETPTVFLHGFGAEASDWAATADRLRASVAIEPHIPELSWRTSYEDQASDLQGRFEFLTLPSSTVVVGHSNGGVVAREWSRLHRLGGIVTIGTPHHGTPIIEHLLAWRTFHQDTPRRLDEVVSAFLARSDFWWVYWFVEEPLRWVSDFSIWSVVNLIVALGAHQSLPVGIEMMPGSTYLRQLNSGSNLYREAVEIPNRVGIASIAHNFYFAGPARAIAPDQADAIAAALYGAAFGFLFWGNYVLASAPFHDVNAIRQGLSLIDVAFYLLLSDQIYCRMVSSEDMSFCEVNDGLVPTYSQLYPDAPNVVIGLDNDGPAHIQEKVRGEDALYSALVNYVHLPTRTGPPPSQAPPPSPAPPPGDPHDPPHAVDPHDPVTITTGVLLPGETLLPEDTVTSTDGRLRFRYQLDGNLVHYDGWTPLWDSNTDGSRPGKAVMQTDGNLVVYDPDNVALWWSGTDGHPGAYLAVQTDGNAVIYDVDGTPLWFTWTFVN